MYESIGRAASFIWASIFKSLSYFLLGSAGSGQLPAGIPAKTVAIFAVRAGPGRKSGGASAKSFGSASELLRGRPGGALGEAKIMPKSVKKSI